MKDRYRWYQGTSGALPYVGRLLKIAGAASDNKTPRRNVRPVRRSKLANEVAVTAKSISMRPMSYYGPIEDGRLVWRTYKKMRDEKKLARFMQFASDVAAAVVAHRGN